MAEGSANSAYEAAVSALYRVPLDVFVEERKRLANELKAAGDKVGALRFAKLARPAISVWAVNQLWWSDQGTFNELIAAAQRMKEGDLSATASHREALARLRTRASSVLTEGGHNATEAALRRITQTLSALAAAGGFAPDLPGALQADRDPPGFDALGLDASTIVVPVREPAPAREPVAPRPTTPPQDAEARAQRERERMEAARLRVEEERKQRERDAESARRRSERVRLEGLLRTARPELTRRMDKLEALKSDVMAAEAAVRDAETRVQRLEAELAELNEE